MESTAYPFPSVERLAMAMYASARKIESLPRVTVYEPSQIVEIAPRPFGQMFGGLCPPAHGWECL